MFTWTLPPLPHGPDLLVLATELAGVGGTRAAARGVGHRLVRRRPPTRPSAASTSSPASRSSLDRVYLGEEQLCDTLDRCLAVSQYLLGARPTWIGEA